ncbi:MAG TPA: hypothetical protein VHV78_18215, partial [Gemmatimonadaceae bacterium]|nr:hypothetical protein [Gemmatimonadaceae bacterium]
MMKLAHSLIVMLAFVPRLSLAGQQCRECDSTDTLRRTHVLPAVGVHVGIPQKASLALGVVLGEDWQVDGRDHTRNVALLGEGGLDAGRLSLAYLRHGYGSF